MQFTPNEAEKFIGSLRNCYLNKLNPKIHKLKVGDYVRVKLKKKTFDKGYLRNWSKEIHQVTEIIGNGYILNNGEKYRINNLQKVNDIEPKKIEKDEVETEMKHGKLVKVQKAEKLGKIDEETGEIELSKAVKPLREKREIKKRVG